MTEPLYTRVYLWGIDNKFKFDNNYGASVVRKLGSYGHREGLWELAVIYWYDEEEWDIVYDTPITNNVIGYLTWNEVEEYLEQIRKLPYMERRK